MASRFVSVHLAVWKTAEGQQHTRRHDDWMPGGPGQQMVPDKEVLVNVKAVTWIETLPRGGSMIHLASSGKDDGNPLFVVETLEELRSLIKAAPA